VDIVSRVLYLQGLGGVDVGNNIWYISTQRSGSV
jgi:hypothetical protein